MRDVVWGVEGSQLTTGWLVTKRERCSPKGQRSVRLAKKDRRHLFRSKSWRVVEVPRKL